MKNCVVCGCELVGRKRKFCSVDCEKESISSRSSELYKKRQKYKVCKLCGIDFLGSDKQVNCQNCGRKRNPVFKKTHKIDTVCPKCNKSWKTEEKKTTQGADRIDYRLCKSCLSESNSLRMRENNPMFNQETLDKVSHTLSGIYYREYRSLCSKKNYENGSYPNFKHLATEEEREKSSIRMRENNPMFNQETRDKVSETRKSRTYDYKRGKEHHLYKGTRARSNYVRLSLKNWIKENLIRSDYTCEVCGSRGATLEVHHLSESFRDCVSRCLDGRNINDLSCEEFEDFRKFVAEEHEKITGLVCCIPCHRDVDTYRR